MSVSILVVDDETDVAELFRQHFRREARQGTYVLPGSQQIRGIPLECFLDPAARLEPGARWVNS